MTRTLEKITGLVEAKRGYIRYLKNRVHDPAPLEREIERHEAQIAVHMAAIDQLQETLKNLPARLEQAEKELFDLLREQQTQLAMERPRAATRSQLELKLATLQAAIRRLDNGPDARGNSPNVSGDSKDVDAGSVAAST